MCDANQSVRFIKNLRYCPIEKIAFNGFSFSIKATLVYPRKQLQDKEMVSILI